MARKRKSSGVKVDLSGVEVGGKTLAEGSYLVSVNEATLETSKNSGADYIKLEFEVSEGSNKGYKLFHNCSLQPQALFNLKAVLLALGFEVPGKAFDLDIKDLIGLECQVEVAHELYEGKKKARIVEFVEPDSDEDEDDDDSDIEELLEDLDMDELKSLAKALKVKVGKKVKTEEALIELIMEEDEEDIQEHYDELFSDDGDDSEDDEDEDDEDEDEDEADYSDMTLKELKAECKDRGIKVAKGAKKDDLIELLEEDDED